MSILATSSNFSRRALCLHCCRGTQQAKRYLLLSIFQAAYHRDTATKPQPSADGVLPCEDLTTSVGVSSPRRQLVWRMRATPPPILLIANHGGSIRDRDACSGRAHKVCSPPRIISCDAEADGRPSSLPQDEVPIKLRCAICSKLAVNAFRTPCCEQMICENCKYPTTQSMSFRPADKNRQTGPAINMPRLRAYPNVG